MVSYFVRYRGQSQDPTGFCAYYGNQHADILRRLPGIRSLILHQPSAWNDPCPVNPGGSLLLAQMTFDAPADLDAALRSQARQEARADFSHFPQFSAEVTHEALAAKVIF
ncbi:MAG TPA: EthD family reductase [Xanthobacteraceae bacterium]|jgi:uncharacterized protein (TIGR02118 family)